MDMDGKESEGNSGPSPKEVDLSDGLLSTFGCSEFEKAICKIVEYLADDSKKIDLWPAGCYKTAERLVGWEKLFTLEDSGIEPSCFAALAAAGWLNHFWFPKWSFQLTPEAVKRIQERHGPKKGEG